MSKPRDFPTVRELAKRLSAEDCLDRLQKTFCAGGEEKWPRLTAATLRAAIIGYIYAATGTHYGGATAKPAVDILSQADFEQVYAGLVERVMVLFMRERRELLVPMFEMG